MKKSYKLRIKEIRMSKGAVNFNKNDEYYTPLSVVRKITGGGIDYDPATTNEKAKEFGLNNFDTIETDGLTTDWSLYRSIWVNPPFSMKKEFIKRAVKTVKENNDIKIWVLVPIETLTTKWFNETVDLYDLFIPNGRIKFEDPSNPKAKSPAFGSVVIELGGTVNGYIKEVQL